MLRKGIVIAALCLLPAVAHAQTARGPFELTLSGSGANGPKFDGFTAAANGSIGFYFNDNFELSGRQSIAYSDIAGESWDASTRVALDFHLPLGDQGQFVPFVGGNIGYVYGDAVHDTFEAAPEAGIKFYVNATTFIFVSMEYQFFFDRHSTTKAFSDGQFIYGLGLGFRF
ncbi:MAG: hypothetical protein JWL69_203 [Phycisphaerales bacterium]|jgi:hypothetical protein|nr:hypothetical protein [Phycisphaerales bacterium]MDB5355710.1 hypothetical protein [Phycisphaerales bacterium]